MLLQFFGELFGRYTQKAYIEVRTVQPDWCVAPDQKKVIHQAYFDNVTDAISGIERVTSTTSHTQIYYGVLPRTSHNSKKHHIVEASVLWADIDAKDHGGSIDAAFKSATSLCTPSITVFTGNGFHVYWLLEHPTQDVGMVERVNQGLAGLVGGDSTHDRTRILRVPGTVNFKNKWTAPMSYIVDAPMCRYRFEDFSQFESVPKALVNKTRYTGTSMVEFDIKEFENRQGYVWRAYVEFGISNDHFGYFGGDRSRLDMSVIGKLAEVGLDESQVWGVMTNPQYGISAKSLEELDKGNSGYLERSIAKAFETALV
jgi:hypothetical protein